MNEPEVDALDRVIDALSQGRLASITAAGREDLPELLATLPAAHWPDRAAGDRITAAVAAKLGADAVAAAAIAQSTGHAGLRILSPEGAGLPSGPAAVAAGSPAGPGSHWPRRQPRPGRRVLL